MPAPGNKCFPAEAMAKLCKITRITKPNYNIATSTRIGTSF